MFGVGAGACGLFSGEGGFGRGDSEAEILSKRRRGGELSRRRAEDDVDILMFFVYPKLTNPTPMTGPFLNEF